ncbi:Hypothetical predicted protein [Cloeon dipterum]|nr:Hypothetical predicted protein [Cloeon dipterum]
MASSPIDSVEVLSKVITAQPKTNSEVAPIPFNHVCPCCNQRITTEVLYRPNSKTHLTATLLCVACCTISWLPYTRNDCKEPHHFCPNCSAYLGKSKY